MSASKPSSLIGPPLQYILADCFFFFQAEDGIRDTSVTGVQTCALPIFESTTPMLFPPSTRWNLRRANRVHMRSTTLLPRSEERRVGKECRSRGSPYH